MTVCFPLPLGYHKRNKLHGFILMILHQDVRAVKGIGCARCACFLDRTASGDGNEKSGCCTKGSDLTPKS